MKILLLAILSVTTAAFACGPFFPPAYLNDLSHNNNAFTEDINVPLELLFLAQEYGLIDEQIYSDCDVGSLEIDLVEFSAAATDIAWTSRIPLYSTYAHKVRDGDTNAVPPDVPATLKEFILYTEGYCEMQRDPDLMEPASWKQLLQLDPASRKHRTTWVYYMLGNLASSHGQPEAGAKYYQACRQAERDGFSDALGLAHASYKREHLAQTNLILRIRSGVQAAGYYRMAGDQKRMTFCLEHLQKDIIKTAALLEDIGDDPLCLEAAALFLFGNRDLITKLQASPPLKITPRLAWFMYKSGRIDEAETYLENCPESDALASWLRFRVAQRNGLNEEAIHHLRIWMHELQHSDRMVFGAWYLYSVSTPSIMEGNLGKLLVTEGDMFAALDCFVKAGSYPDAALIAERYLKTAAVKAYVDTFEQRPSDYLNAPQYQSGSADQSLRYVQYNLSNLLARRLFREGRMTEAKSYYSPQWATMLASYLDAMKKGKDTRLSRDERAAHLYHAARIMRWRGMELSGTAHAPDYTITMGAFDFGGISREGEIAGPEWTNLYEQTAPEPNSRFHYRPIAVALAEQAADLARNRHERATILWSAGTWIMNKYPREADVYYKQLARIPFQPLAKAADEQRWFPAATPDLETVFRSEKYITPKQLAAVAAEYVRP